jgi:hypothetical protein
MADLLRDTGSCKFSCAHLIRVEIQLHSHFLDNLKCRRVSVRLSVIRKLAKR